MMQRINYMAVTTAVAGALLVPTAGMATGSTGSVSGRDLWRGENPPVVVKVKQTKKVTKVKLRNKVRPEKPRVTIRYVVKPTDGKRSKAKKVIRVTGKKRVVKLPARTVKVAVKLPGMKRAIPYFKTSIPKVDIPNQGGGSTDPDSPNQGVPDEVTQDNWQCRKPFGIDFYPYAEWMKPLYHNNCGVSLASIGGRLFNDEPWMTDPAPYASYTFGAHDCEQGATVTCWVDITFPTDEWTRFNRTNVTINGVPVTTQEEITTRLSFTPESYQFDGSEWTDLVIPNGTEIGAFYADPIGNQHRPPHWEATSIGLPAGSRIPVFLYNDFVDWGEFWAGTSSAHQLGGFVLYRTNVNPSIGEPLV
jgi:hypothetical protein